MLMWMLNVPPCTGAPNILLIPPHTWKLDDEAVCTELEANCAGYLVTSACGCVVE